LERRPDEGMLERLYGEVKALADRLSRLEAELGRLHELDELSERISKLEKAVMNRKEEVASPARVIVERAATTPRKEPVKIPAELDQMPSFLRDNPWIEVLSQRR
jgi:predicted nuclease with TOPRIM domain